MTNVLEVSHARARALLAGGAPVFVPVNPVEYHGPHLSLHNDALVSRGIAKDLHAGLAALGNDWPFLTISDLEMGVDPTPGPGTRPVSFRDVSATVVDACRALVALGAQRVVLVTFHGAPLHSLAIEAGVQWLARRGVPALSPMNLLLRTLLDIRPEDYPGVYETIADPGERARALREAPRDVHAGFFETSMSLHYAPESVDPAHARLPPCPEVTDEPKLLAASRTAARLGNEQLAKELRLAAFGVGWHALRPFPGYTSRPSLASREAGACIAPQIVSGFVDTTHRVLKGEEAPPAPIMRWMEPLTLRGTVPTGAKIGDGEVARFD